MNELRSWLPCQHIFCPNLLKAHQSGPCTNFNSLHDVQPPEGGQNLLLGDTKIRTHYCGTLGFQVWNRELVDQDRRNASMDALDKVECAYGDLLQSRFTLKASKHCQFQNAVASLDCPT